MANFVDDYGFFAKLLHKFAFKTAKMQINLAESEYQQHLSELLHIPIKKPIFITGLPRAGTTVLLEVLAGCEQFSYHTYQDMPFIFTPLMWRDFTAKYAKADTPKMRAHNDGIKINQQSPEAFEERFYVSFFADKYQGDTLSADDYRDENGKFELFYRHHIQKLIYRDGGNKRYLSKNNLNITRISFIKQMFDDALILLPFRHPLQHALSLYRQHMNFTQLHKENPFAKEYMAAIGHFDFGENFKPVNFNQWLDRCDYRSHQLNFWLKYWIACYEYLLEHCPGDTCLVGFESINSQPQAYLKALGEYIDVPVDDLLKVGCRIRTIEPRTIDPSAYDKHLLKKAEEIYQTLIEKSKIKLG